MSSLVNSMAKANLDEFEETSSEHLSETDVNASKDDESDSSDTDAEDDSESDEDHGGEDSEDYGDGPKSDKGDSEDAEGENRAALQSSLVYNSLWTANFCPPPIREFQKSRKCFGV
ncbi:unnamed protein product [Rotaria sp. Silwood2]|nr:unnamed protein product [Rotaria sp. Silwood2]CAF2943969.1 unnamed protein product [Rotaria sp. Silwood2]CAF3337599.1 unnamed protein product [Rotaria sp. Silwood2]CAF4226900.1 unnamed protein product [Rotaria sp. Silwood2]CAF4460932.1 unnamed protein product [Rotaria sp. Silwood2]